MSPRSVILAALLGMFVALVAVAMAQESGPSGAGPWAVVVTQATVVETFGKSTVVVHNSGEAKVLLVAFATIEACQAARNLALNPSGFSIPLGTGGGASAHVGRSVTECFQQ